jgi:cytochrome c-type biogenesis protein CcmF
VEKRDTLKSWTILLAILAFSFSLIGAFVVRSGVITSVHAFANDPERGVFLLYIMGFFIGGSLTLYAWRAPSLRSQTAFSTVSRESGLVLNNVLLVVATLVVFFGTMWPLLAEVLTGRMVSVGPPFFDLAFTPFMVALAMVLPIFSVLPWKRGDLARAARPFWGVAALSVALGALVWSLQTGGSMLAPIGITLAAWVVVGALADVAGRVKLFRAPLAESFRRCRSLPRADWGKTLGHAGLGVTIFGIAALTAWETDDIRVLNVGDEFRKGPYELRLEAVEEVRGPNWIAEVATISFSREGRERGVLLPEKRFYPVQQFPTTQAAIDRSLTRDLYVTLGDRQAGGGYAVRTYIKPFSNWIWLGALIMAAGGALSLTDRRFRVGAPARRSAPPAAVPAE